MVNERKPHFLEVFLPNLSSDRLKVPSKFVEHLEDRISGSLSLIGPSGNAWHVDLNEYNGHLYFHDGWATFVRDHSIQCGDTLVFRYNGNSNFNVQIFDESSCEKDEAFYVNCGQGASDCNENLIKKRGRKEASMKDLVADKKLRGSWMPVHLTSEHDNRRSVVLAIPACSGPDRVANVVNVRVKNNSSNGKKACKKSRSGKLNAQGAANWNLPCPFKLLAVKWGLLVLDTGIKKMPSISKFIESRAANYFTSTLPYFVRVMCYSNISGNGTMKIPTSFSTEHLPKNRIKVTLMNLNGDCWTVNSIPTAKRTRIMHTFCGGWLTFVRANNIKIEDVCIFELVGDNEMRVQILRLGLEGLEGQIGSNSDDVIGVGLEGTETVENIPQDTGIDPSKDTDQTNKPYTLHNVQHKIDLMPSTQQDTNQTNKPYTLHNVKHKTDLMPSMQQEAASSIGTVDDSTSVQDPSCASPSIGTGDGSTADEHLICSTEETVLQICGNDQEDLQARFCLPMQPTPEGAKDSWSFSSSNPNFMKVMMSSNVGHKFGLNVPRNFAVAHLPCHKANLVLRNLRGESWNVVAARYGNQTKICGGWMSFARMNNLKIGDICVFELVDKKVLQVSVFEGNHQRLECTRGEAVADDSSASVQATEWGVLADKQSVASSGHLHSPVVGEESCLMALVSS